MLPAGSRRIHDLEARHGGGQTHFLGDALRTVDDKAHALVRHLRPLPFQSGVLLCVAGQPILLEVFDSHRTLASSWAALLHAAAVDGIGQPAVPTPGRRARRFIERVQDVDTLRHGGSEQVSRATSPYVTLAALS